MELIHGWSQGRMNLLPSWHTAGSAKLLAWVCRRSCSEQPVLKGGALSIGSSGWRAHWSTKRSHQWRLQLKKASSLESELMRTSLLTMLELNRQENPWLLNPVPIGAAISPTGVNYSMYATWTLACVPWTVSSAKKTYVESMIWPCLPVLITSTHPCENIKPPGPMIFHSDPPKSKTQLHTEGKNPMW